MLANFERFFIILYFDKFPLLQVWWNTSYFKKCIEHLSKSRNFPLLETKLNENAILSKLDFFTWSLLQVSERTLHGKTFVYSFFVREIILCLETEKHDYTRNFHPKTDLLKDFLLPYFKVEKTQYIKNWSFEKTFFFSSKKLSFAATKIRMLSKSYLLHDVFVSWQSTFFWVFGLRRPLSQTQLPVKRFM